MFGVGYQGGEPQRVDVGRVQKVAGPSRDEKPWGRARRPGRLDRPAQVRHVDVKRGQGGRGRSALVEIVDQRVGGDDHPWADRQPGQDGSLPWATEADGGLAVTYFKGTHDAEIHALHLVAQEIRRLAEDPFRE